MRICIVQSVRNKPSETFIRAHSDGLPGEKFVVHGLGDTFIDENPVLSQGLVPRAWRKLWRMLARDPRGWERKHGFDVAIRRLRPDVVLAEYGTKGAQVMPTCRRYGVPLVVHFHGFDASSRPVLAQYGEQYREMFRYASSIVAVSNAMVRQLVELGASEERIALIPYGVNTSQFGGALPSQNGPRFLAVGRFVEKKAPHLTLLAMADVLTEAPEAELVMIGDGPLLGPCQALANALGISSQVRFLGVQSPAVVQVEMRRARAFVQHSLQASDGDSEGTPVAIIEAGASGLPVVSTRHAGIPDVVLDGVTGLLCDEGDTRSMASAMLKLATDAELASSLGRAARKHVQTNFEATRQIGLLAEVLVQAANTPAVS